MITTLRFRVKNKSSLKVLDEMSKSVNYVWNYCNEVNLESWLKFRKTYSSYELNQKTSGCSELLNINSQTIQAVCEEYIKCTKQFKKIKLKWRSNQKSLGWVPFKALSVKLNKDSILYYKCTFKFWNSFNFDGKVRCGSFNKNNKGQWFANLVIEKEFLARKATGKECGIDLGIKTLATLSDGVSFHRESLVKKYADKLAMAQRAKKKKLVSAIHLKIKNKRKDWNHKTSTLITKEYDKIVVGNVSSSKLKKTKMAKSVSDAGWYGFKSMLEYKAIRLGSKYKEVNESYSTVTCYSCKERTGPKGIGNLSVREWTCSNCDSRHFRDVNAAKNILSFSV